MPELPEVETVRRGLAPHLEGRRVAGVELRLARMLEVGRPRDLRALAGHRFLAPRRHGKYLLLDLDGPGPGHTLVVHLGMTGQLTMHPAGAAPLDRFVRLASGLQRPVGPHTVDRHTHLVVTLEGEDRLLFRDPRTFGRLLVVPRDRLEATPRLRRLGPDALGLPDPVFVERLWARRGQRHVKSLLLDQGLVAGVGNIYADEACFAAGIRPQRRSARLTRAEAGRLAGSVQEALRRGIDNCGTSFSDFVGPDGHPGSNLEVLAVYARGGEPCVGCGGVLSKGVVAQRGTVWCPRCQR